MVVPLAQDGVGIGVVGFDVVAFNFLDDLVRLADLLVLDIDHGIDEMLALERTEAVFPAKTGEKGAVVKGCLPVKIKLGRPPGGGAVLEFNPEGMEAIARALRTSRGEILHLEVSGLLEVMIVSHDVRTFLSESLLAEEEKQKQTKKT